MFLVAMKKFIPSFLYALLAIMVVSIVLKIASPLKRGDFILSNMRNSPNDSDEQLFDVYLVEENILGILKKTKVAKDFKIKLLKKTDRANPD